MGGGRTNSHAVNGGALSTDCWRRRVNSSVLSTRQLVRAVNSLVRYDGVTPCECRRGTMWQVPRGIGKGLGMENLMAVVILVLSIFSAVLIKAVDWYVRDAARWRHRYHVERQRRVTAYAKGEASWVLE